MVRGGSAVYEQKPRCCSRLVCQGAVLAFSLRSFSLVTLATVLSVAFLPQEPAPCCSFVLFPAIKSQTLVSPRAAHSHEVAEALLIVVFSPWVASGQTNNRVGTQPHPSADKWIKVLLSMALPTRGTCPSSTHHQSLPSGSLHKPLR